MPAVDELKAIYAASSSLNKILETKTDAQPFATGWYWSSTEEARGSALGCDFRTGNASMSNKLRNGSVRAVRAF